MEGEQEQLLEILQAYDFILVDANFFGTANKLTERLYELKHFFDLNRLEEELKDNHLAWRWQNRSLLNQPHVYTIPEVIQELNDFERIIQESYQWHRQDQRIACKKNFKERIIFKNASRHVRTNVLIEKARKNIQEKKINPHKTPQALIYLNCLLQDARQIIHRLKIYPGPIFNLPRNIEGASETDYRLAGAAVGYSLQNPDKKVEILTCDNHVHKILYSYLTRNIIKVINRNEKNQEPEKNQALERLAV